MEENPRISRIQDDDVFWLLRVRTDQAATNDLGLSMSALSSLVRRFRGVP